MATPHLHEADERGEAVAKLGQVRVEAALVLAAEAGGEREDDPTRGVDGHVQHARRDGEAEDGVLEVLVGYEPSVRPALAHLVRVRVRVRVRGTVRG